MRHRLPPLWLAIVRCFGRTVEGGHLSSPGAANPKSPATTATEARGEGEGEERTRGVASIEDGSGGELRSHSGSRGAWSAAARTAALVSTPRTPPRTRDAAHVRVMPLPVR